MEGLENQQRLLQSLFLVLNILLNRSSVSAADVHYYCGSMRIQEPFLDKNSSYSPLLRHMLLCKSENVYLRTTLGLFKISSIDYANKLLTVALTPCVPSASSNYVFPHHLSAGFPSPPSPNSLVLWNCSSAVVNNSAFMSVPCNPGSTVSSCCFGPNSGCRLIKDAGFLEEEFHSEVVVMKCTHYSAVYMRRDDDEKMGSGMKISFDIPSHVPNPCDQCRKPGGNCGSGLRCLCFPIKCKDKVISKGATLEKPNGNIVLSCIMVLLLIVFQNFKVGG